MNPARLQQIQDLYHSAREREPDERGAFLAEACGLDEELRQEVESLLAQNGSSGGPLQRPAISLLAEAMVAPVSTGDLLGPYKIESLLGAGGMGQVYKARDTRLGRPVAIKIANQQFSERFEREARAISSLNHPNICTLYDVGPNYLVMELIEGPTLAERIAQGPIPVEEALGVAKQIADALEAAHEKGIVHRDLKPANIKIRPDGSVKVLDFGLAKASSEQAEFNSDSPTVLSESGVILGTAGYMSPEQARGQKVDKRTDIWAFGVVLYEVVVGQRLFERATLSDTLAAVIKDEPDWTPVPARFLRVLRRCLEKDSNRRLRDISGVELLLDDVTAAPSQSRFRKTGNAGWIAAVAIPTLVAAALTFVHFREKPAVARPMRLQIQLPEDLALWPLFSLSPDGRKLAFIAGTRLWVHFLESGESRNLADAGGTPFWSPDSRFIGYPSGQDRKLKRIEATGGPPQTIADFPPTFLGWGGGAWNRDDVIVFGWISLFRVPASGGVPVPITALDPARHEKIQWAPFFLPDRRHFLYTSVSTDAEQSAIYLGSIDARPEQRSSTRLMASSGQAQYAPSADPSAGYLLFVREKTLMAQSFDNRRFELKGQAAPVAEQIGDSRTFSVSANDGLVFQKSGKPDDWQLTWYDRAGKVIGTVEEPGTDPLLSPNGTRLAVTKPTGFGLVTKGIWLLDLARGGASTRFTFGSTSYANPVWSPDGNRLIFSSYLDGAPSNLYQKPANGSKDETILLKSNENKTASSWSPDGHFLLYTVIHPKTKADIWVLPLDGDKKPVPFLITEFEEADAHFSPDGHWVAYASNESGQPEVYVRPFSMNSAGTAVEAGGKWQISNGGFCPTLAQ